MNNGHACRLSMSITSVVVSVTAWLSYGVSDGSHSLSATNLRRLGTRLEESATTVIGSECRQASRKHALALLCELGIWYRPTMATCQPTV
jgi:hypothetical protein